VNIGVIWSNPFVSFHEKIIRRTLCNIPLVGRMGRIPVGPRATVATWWARVDTVSAVTVAAASQAGPDVGYCSHELL
jgi:hypothetical protein